MITRNEAKQLVNKTPLKKRKSLKKNTIVDLCKKENYLSELLAHLNNISNKRVKLQKVYNKISFLLTKNCLYLPGQYK